jgi:hypothetical protein
VADKFETGNPNFETISDAEINRRKRTGLAGNRRGFEFVSISTVEFAIS